jgi:PadR family transcriptional regulator AphA
MPMVKLPPTIEHALLGFVRHRPMYGYEIYQRLMAGAELGLVWNIKQSQLYALLAGLEQDGMLSSRVEQQGARPPRKVLAITARGAAAFDDWVRSPVEHGRDFRVEFLAKLYCAREEGEPVARELLAAQRRATTERLEELRDRAAALDPAGSFDWLVARFRVSQLEAALGWLNLCDDWLAGPQFMPVAGAAAAGR